MSFLALALATTALACGSGPLPICQDVRPRLVETPKPDRPQRLGDLPPAEAYLTVMRTENGCIRPVLVREERAR